jgi:hypothetical protein
MDGTQRRAAALACRQRAAKAVRSSGVSSGVRPPGGVLEAGGEMRRPAPRGKAGEAQGFGF